MGELKKPEKNQRSLKETKSSIKTMMMKQLLGAVVCLLTFAKASSFRGNRYITLQEMLTDYKNWIEDHQHDMIATDRTRGMSTGESVGQYYAGSGLKSDIEALGTWDKARDRKFDKFLEGVQENFFRLQELPRPTSEQVMAEYRAAVHNQQLTDADDWRQGGEESDDR